VRFRCFQEAGGYIDAATVFWDWNTFDYAETFTIEGTDWDFKYCPLSKTYIIPDFYTPPQID